MSDPLSDAAAANDSDRRGSSETLMVGDASGQLRRFHRPSSDSTMSTNVSGDKVMAFGDTQLLLSARSLAVRRAGGDASAGLAEFAGRPLSARREAFEDLWDDGRSAIYGALNVGGMGAESYGPFCLVIEDPVKGATGLAVFPDDTLQRYTDVRATVNVALVVSEVTSWLARGDLAVIERAGPVLAASSPAAWAEIVCRTGHYLEVVRLGPADLRLVGAVRLRREYRRHLNLLRQRRARGVPMVPTEAAEAEVFEAVTRWRRSIGVRVESV